MDEHANCILCRGSVCRWRASPRRGLGAAQLWRLTASLVAEVPGFCYLEPVRHVPHITDLEGREAATFGVVLARVSAALKQATGAELVYVYVFGGGVPHLHVHLAPHTEGDALSEQMVRGPLVERRLPSGLTEYRKRDLPAAAREAEQRAAAARVRELLTSDARV